MGFGKELLDLTVEYMRSLETRATVWDSIAMGAPAGRDPEVIAADYERVIMSILAPDMADIAPEL